MEYAGGKAGNVLGPGGVLSIVLEKIRVDFRFWIADFRFKVSQYFRFWIVDFGFKVSQYFRFWIVDFGFKVFYLFYLID
jgi:hypothetical protein